MAARRGPMPLLRVCLRLLGFGLAGLAQALSIAAPWSGQPLWWLQLLSIAALVWQLERLRTPQHPVPVRSAFLYGWLFTTSWLCGTFWWLFISMHTYGGMPAPMAAAAVLALAAALALYYAIACGLFVRWAPRSRWGAASLFVALWTLGELLRGSWFTGFPWGAGGYAHVDGPLSTYIPWLGVYGVGAVGTGIAAVVALAAPDARTSSAGRAPIALALGLLVVPAALLALRGAPDDARNSQGRLQVELLQGNIPQDEKFVPGGGVVTALQWYGQKLRDAKAPLVITPETAIPLLPSQLPPGYLEAIAARYASGTQAAIVGLPVGGRGEGYSNAVIGYRPGTAPYQYDKHHLVPFGEFVPRMFRWFTDLMNIPLGDFRSGGLAQAPFVWQGQRIAPNICYEDLFGDEIGANFRDASNVPTILLNVSNIAWFGDSVAIDQHLAISRMRALEFARPMVRSTNTGATVVIDHRGRVTHELPRLTREVLVAEVEGRSGLTPYAWWVSRFGLWPLWILALLTVVIAGLRQRRHQRGSGSGSGR